MKDDIHSYLSQFLTERVVYIPNPGNAGDSVIATATYQCFNSLGLNYELPDPRYLDAEGKTIIYGGGGNLVGPGTFSYKTISRLHANARRLVILPHTIKNVDSLLSDFGSNVDIICRERVSYEYVRKNARRANAFLMDDMAFNLDCKKTLEWSSRIYTIPSLVGSYLISKALRANYAPGIRNILRMPMLSYRRKRIGRLVDKSKIHCFRTDGERTNMEIPPDNYDISQLLMAGVEMPAAAFLAASEVLRLLSVYDEIHTNRLHIGISSALLGKNVRFYANNYYKCQAVYEYSMKNRFPNLTWMG